MTVKSKRKGRRWILLALPVAMLVILGGVAAAATVFRPHLYSGTMMQGAQPAPSLAELHTVDGEPVDFSRWEDELVLVYFGYLNCPDVCPTTLNTVAHARAALSEEDQARTNLVMVSVDPARDPVDKLQGYVSAFDPTFVAAGGTVEAIDRAATAYGVYYFLHEGTIEEGYAVDHTASVMGVGPDGSLRVVWGPTVTAEQFTADIQELLS